MDWSPKQATVAYSIAMEADRYLTGNRFNDVTFLQGLLGDAEGSSQKTRMLAWLLHLGNGVMLAQIYAALVQSRLPGPAWLRGLLFGEAFVLAVWPLTPLVDRYHPMVKKSRLPALANWTSFWQNALRHGVFGFVLGLLSPSSERSGSPASRRKAHE